MSEYSNLNFKKDPDAKIQVAGNLYNYVYLDTDNSDEFSEYYLFRNISRFIAKEFMKVKFSFTDQVPNKQLLDYLLNLKPNSNQTSNQLLYEFAYSMLTTGSCYYRIYSNARAVESVTISRTPKAGFLEFENLAIKQHRPTQLLAQYAKLISNLSTKHSDNILNLSSSANFRDDEESSAAQKVNSRLENFSRQAHDSGVIFTQKNEEVKSLPNFTSPDSSALADLKALILGEYNLNDNILLGKYTEEEYRAFFKTNLQPLIDSIIELVNIALIDSAQYRAGARIMANIDMTQFATLNSFREFADKAIYDGLICADEARAIIGLGELPSGVGKILYTNLNAKRVTNPDGTIYEKPVTPEK